MARRESSSPRNKTTRPHKQVLWSEEQLLLHGCVVAAPIWKRNKMAAARSPSVQTPPQRHLPCVTAHAPHATLATHHLPLTCLTYPSSTTLLPHMALYPPRIVSDVKEVLSQPGRRSIDRR
ncbi:hypothetical protein C0Q70_13441 [Pomacea canaliculata]|uniref:Uncharacterized protein n=1 Tax=Pomacea canaliculata TaxID=400727 RepID=A0A2T7NX83_POMCA|nr:hypothetical protein C0Q70_13441 [Pomacea canaliculata]